jgi:hypothetical protein
MFKTWYVVGILMLQEWFDVDILDFQFELCDRFLHVFLVWRLFRLLLKNWVIFYKTSGHPE